MDPTATIVLFLVVALGIVLGTVAVGAALYFLMAYLSPEPTEMQKRLSKIKQLHADLEAGEEPSAVRNIASLLRPSEYESEALRKLFEKYSFTKNIEKSIKQAGMTTPVDKFIMWFLIIPFFGFGVMGLLTKFLPILGFSVMVPGGALGALIFKKNARLGKFTAQLPDALSLITSSLRAGHSFQSAIGVVASEMPAPIGSEFAVVVNDINLGIPVKEAMQKMNDSLHLPDVQMFSTAVMIQREAGGNLAEVLDKLSYTIRERFKLKGQIASLTGQSRMTGYVLGFAPVAMATVLTLFFPDYIKPLYDSPLGWLMLGVAAVMQMIGAFIMMKIINIRV